MMRKSKIIAMSRPILTLMLLGMALPDRAEEPVRPTAAPLYSEQPVRAQLKAKQSTLIAANMTGYIKAMSVRDGDHFQKGQPLVNFDCSEEQSRLAQAEATRAKKQKQYEVNIQLNRLKSVSTLEVEVSEAEVKEASAATQVMQAVVAKCTILAPFNGRVAERIARTDQTVKAGDPLMEILDDGDMEIEFIAPSRWLAWLKPGYKFSILLDETGQSYPAEIARKAGAVDPVSQSIKVYGRITQKTASLMSGMSGTVQITPPMLKAP